VKKLVVCTALGLAAMVAALELLPSGMKVGPEPIAYGRDTCATCRMHLSQPGFAGELRDRLGTLTKYDDLGCMLRAMIASRGEILEAWVEDHERGELVPLLTATLVRSPNTHTPMGYGVVAFAAPTAGQEYASGHGGEVVRLEDLVGEPARLVHVAMPVHEHRDDR
jgi:copper chaperone NosL